jgi:hypothetical protein
LTNDEDDTVDATPVIAFGRNSPVRIICGEYHAYFPPFGL